MEIVNDWEVKLIEEARRIAEHGFGKIEFTANESREIRTKLIISSGCSFIYFIKKTIDLDRKKII